MRAIVAGHWLSLLFDRCLSAAAAAGLAVAGLAVDSHGQISRRLGRQISRARAAANGNARASGSMP